MQRQAVTDENDHKEEQVCDQLDKVCDEIEVEQEHRLVFPRFFTSEVDGVQNVLSKRRQQAGGE